MTLRILHLFPTRLDINGDVGNVLALARRARWRGIPVEVVPFEGGEPPADAHLVAIGSGPLSAQRSVLPDLLPIADLLRGLVADGTPLLAVAGGWQLLGSGLVTAEGETVTTARVTPSRTRLEATRRVGETVVRGRLGDVTGFANHSAATVLEDGADPLGRVVAGPDTGEAEGLVAGSIRATTLHGSVLPLNPGLADELLDAATERAGIVPSEEPDAAARDRADDSARSARAAIAARLRLAPAGS